VTERAGLENGLTTRGLLGFLRFHVPRRFTDSHEYAGICNLMQPARDSKPAVRCGV